MSAEKPILRLTWAEFKALPEYSHTLPTGITAGKRWRRHHDYFDREAAAAAYPDLKQITQEQAEPFCRTKIWVGEFGEPVEPVGRYKRGEADMDVPIIWYRPIIICRSGEGISHG